MSIIKLEPPTLRRSMVVRQCAPLRVHGPRHSDVHRIRSKSMPVLFWWARVPVGLVFLILPQKRPGGYAEIFPGKSFYCIIVIYEARGTHG